MNSLLESPQGADALITDLPDLISEFVSVLNEKEATRRIEVNGHHLAKYGRLLYPEGGQYATFSADTRGRKFVRIVMDTGGDHGRSVHCFIDKATGDVLKAAGWKTPAKGARFNLLDADSRERLFDRCEFAGGYLYANRFGR